jgi:hypothetical protein
VAVSIDDLKGGVKFVRDKRRLVLPVCQGFWASTFTIQVATQSLLCTAWFREVEESGESKSRASVPAFEPGDSAELPHSLYVEAFK